jgi:hypothetical protein
LADGKTLTTKNKLTLGKEAEIIVGSATAGNTLVLESGAKVDGQGMITVNGNGTLHNKTSNAGKDMWADKGSASVIVKHGGTIKTALTSGDVTFVGNASNGVVRLMDTSASMKATKTSMSVFGKVELADDLKLSEEAKIENGAELTIKDNLTVTTTGALNIVSGGNVTVAAGKTIAISTKGSLTVNGHLTGTDATSQIDIKAGAALSGSNLNGLAVEKVNKWSTNKWE